MNPLKLLKKYWQKQEGFKRVTKRELLQMICSEPMLTIRPIFRKK